MVCLGNKQRLFCCFLDFTQVFAISCLTTSNLPWFMDRTFLLLMQSCSLHYRTLLALPVTSTPGWFFLFFWFLLWLSLFTLSIAISPLFSSSTLGTYWPGEVIFQCHIFLPSLTVHGVLKARIFKWFVIPFSSVPRFVRTPHCGPSVLGGPIWHGS